MANPEQIPTQEQAPVSAGGKGGPAEYAPDAESEALEVRELDEAQRARLGELERGDAEVAQALGEVGAMREEVKTEVSRRTFINRLAVGLVGGAAASLVPEKEAEAQVYGYERNYGAEIARDFAYLGGVMAINYFQKAAYEAYLREMDVLQKAQMAEQNVAHLKAELDSTTRQFGVLEANLKHQERVLRYQKGSAHLEFAQKSAAYYEKNLESADISQMIQGSRMGESDPQMAMMQAKLKEVDREADELFARCASICIEHQINEKRPGREVNDYMRLVGQLAPLHLRIGYLHRALGQWELETQMLGIELEKSRDERKKKAGRAKIASILGTIGAVALSLAVRRPSYMYY